MRDQFIYQKRILLPVLCLCLMIWSVSSAGDWIPIGPSGPIITSLHFDRSAEILFASAYTGFLYYPVASGAWISREEVGAIGKDAFTIINRADDPGTVITGCVNAWFKGNIRYSDDWGVSNSVTYDSDGGKFVDIQADPDSPPHLYACGWSDITPGELVESHNGGMTWTPLTGVLHTWMTGIAINPTNPEIVYVSGDAIVTKSIDGGATWTQSSSGLPAGLGIYCIEISPGNPLLLLSSNDNGIYRTVDGGASWNLVNSDNSSCQHFAFNPADPSMVVGVTFSPYRLLGSVDSGLSWTDWTDDYPGASMIDAFFSGTGDTLFVASALNGVFLTQPTTGIGDSGNETENVPGLLCGYPNPFSGSTEISFSLPENLNAAERSMSTIAIFDSTGRLIREWNCFELYPADQVTWDGTDSSSRELPPGLYIVHLSSPAGNAVTRVVMLN